MSKGMSHYNLTTIDLNYASATGGCNKQNCSDHTDELRNEILIEEPQPEPPPLNYIPLPSKTNVRYPDVESIPLPMQIIENTQHEREITNTFVNTEVLEGLISITAQSCVLHHLVLYEKVDVEVLDNILDSNLLKNRSH